jgi:hypothetical protein
MQPKPENKALEVGGLPTPQTPPVRKCDQETTARKTAETKDAPKKDA